MLSLTVGCHAVEHKATNIKDSDALRMSVVKGRDPATIDVVITNQSSSPQRFYFDSWNLRFSMWVGDMDVYIIFDPNGFVSFPVNLYETPPLHTECFHTIAPGKDWVFTIRLAHLWSYQLKFISLTISNDEAADSEFAVARVQYKCNGRFWEGELNVGHEVTVPCWTGQLGPAYSSPMRVKIHEEKTP